MPAVEHVSVMTLTPSSLDLESEAPAGNFHLLSRQLNQHLHFLFRPLINLQDIPQRTPLDFHRDFPQYTLLLNPPHAQLPYQVESPLANRQCFHRVPRQLCLLEYRQFIRLFHHLLTLLLFQ
jgi:hypothetical protein